MSREIHFHEIKLYKVEEKIYKYYIRTYSLAAAENIVTPLHPHTTSCSAPPPAVAESENPHFPPSFRISVYAETTNFKFLQNLYTDKPVSV